MFPIDSIDTESALAIALVGLAVAVALAVVGLIIAAVFSILFSPEELGMKAVWLILVFIAPVIGALAWFLVGRNHSHRHARGRMGSYV
ncbi:PLD nuclease N-terminal domain-containing protein [Nocardiopsis oceani]